jgi:hypothetical protein
MSETAPEPVEITITLVGAEQKFSKKFLEYNLVSMSKTDPIIRELIEDARTEVKFDVEEVKIRASF